MPDWKNIIIHHSAGSDGIALETSQIRRQHKEKGWLDIGYHFLIELAGNPFIPDSRDYEIICGRMLDTAGAHCKGRNRDSIGICMVGNYEINFLHQMQWELLIKLCKSLCWQFDIPVANIYPHHHFFNTLCPGKYLAVDKVQQSVTRLMVADVKS